ncbi:MAG: DUF1292 domain-containing protein [Clostridia bacterium]|nr:DUF1292 domain-containing protein [Clostridia bacterium]
MDNYNEIDIVTLTDEDGTESEFEVIETFEFEGKTYYALLPVEDEEGEYVLLRLEQDENGEDILSTIDDDDEFDRVADYFDDEFLNEIDYDGDDK